MLLHNFYIPYILALDLTIGDVVDNNGPECQHATAVENGLYEALDSAFESASVNAFSKAEARTGSALEALIAVRTSQFLFSLRRSSATSFVRGGALEEMMAATMGVGVSLA